MSHYEKKVLATKRVKIQGEKSLVLLFEGRTWEVIFNRTMFLDPRVYDELKDTSFVGKTRDEAYEMAEELLTTTKYKCKKR